MLKITFGAWDEIIEGKIFCLFDKDSKYMKTRTLSTNALKISSLLLLLIASTSYIFINYLTVTSFRYLWEHYDFKSVSVEKCLFLRCYIQNYEYHINNTGNINYLSHSNVNLTCYILLYLKFIIWKLKFSCGYYLSLLIYIYKFFTWYMEIKQVFKYSRLLFITYVSPTQNWILVRFND